MLVEVWPEQANLADCKGQTPLMLAADAGLERAVVALLKNPGVDIDAQDYIGRTALHAAVTGSSISSVRMLLDRVPDMTLVTHDENQSVLHTAVRMGHLEIASLIQEEFPFLINSRNLHGNTPPEECEESLLFYEEFAQAMGAYGRVAPSRDQLHSICAMFTELAKV